MYHDLEQLKLFFLNHPLSTCFINDQFSPKNSYEFLSKLAFDSENIGRCISLIVNIITLTTLQKFSKDLYQQYQDQIMKGELITAICNNEALNHGSNLNTMSSYIEYHENETIDVKINKKIITNVGAADLLFINLLVKGKQENKFAIACFEKQDIEQRSLSEEFLGLSSCPTGSVQADFIDYKNLNLLTSINKSLLVMRHMYNMERFLIGCIMAGILKKITFYAFEESETDLSQKFNNQYLQEKVINIFNLHIKFDSLIKNCISYMNSHSTIEPLLALIKISSISDVLEAIILLKEICGAKSYFRNHVSHRLLADHEAIFNLGGTKELMKQTLFNDLKNKKTRDSYV